MQRIYSAAHRYVDTMVKYNGVSLLGILLHFLVFVLAGLQDALTTTNWIVWFLGFVYYQGLSAAEWKEKHRIERESFQRIFIPN